MAHEAAKVFAQAQDYLIYIWYIDEYTRAPFARWRVWDGLTGLVEVASTLRAPWHGLNSGVVAVICVCGGRAAVDATWPIRVSNIEKCQE